MLLRKNRNGCLFFLFFLFLIPTLTNASRQPLSDQEKYIKTIDYIHKMGKNIYCYWDLKRSHYFVDWDTIINTGKQKINAHTTPEQFQKILTEIAASLHDGHVNYIYETNNKLFYLPIEIKKIKNNYYIENVDQDKMWPNFVDLHPGDRVLGVDEKNIHDYIYEKSKLISGSTEHSVMSRASASINTLEKFKKAPQKNVTLTIEKFLSNRIKHVELPWLVYDRSPKTNQKLSDIVHSKILPENIGLLTLTQMSHDLGRDAHIAYIKKELNALKNTRALIIDVRNNGGGYGEIGDSVIAHFISHKVKRYRAQLKNSQQAIYARPNLIETFSQTDPSRFEYSEWQDYFIEPLSYESPSYVNPVYVLTNENCFSACDTFVDSFSSNQIGEVLGTQTGGGTGYPLWVKLPWNFGNFRFSILRGYSNHGRFLEGTGTFPDEEISNNPDDLHENVDGELLEAYQYVVNELDFTPMNQAANPKLAMNFVKKHAKVIPFGIREEHSQFLQSK